MTCFLLLQKTTEDKQQHSIRTHLQFNRRFGYLRHFRQRSPPLRLEIWRVECISRRPSTESIQEHRLKQTPTLVKKRDISKFKMSATLVIEVNSMAKDRNQPHV